MKKASRSRRLLRIIENPKNHNDSAKMKTVRIRSATNVARIATDRETLDSITLTTASANRAIAVIFRSLEILHSNQYLNLF